MLNNFTDIAVIGLGPAGMAAVNQFKRYTLAPRIFTQRGEVSLLKNAAFVYNYLGFQSIKGNQLLGQFTKDALKGMKEHIVYDEVILLDYLESKKLFYIKTASSIEHYSRYVLVATGTKPNLMDCHITSVMKPYVFYEPYPILEVKNKTIVIVGAGDAACVYARELSKENNIQWLIRGHQLRAIPALQDSIHSQDIHCQFNVTVRQLVQGKCTPLKVITSSEIPIDAHYLIPAIGRKPNLLFLSRRLTDNRKMKALEEYLHFAGDVINSNTRQVAIATGEGIKAAVKIYQSMVQK